jgi:hypothetical protein
MSSTLTIRPTAAISLTAAIFFQSKVDRPYAVVKFFVVVWSNNDILMGGQSKICQKKSSDIKIGRLK